MITNSPVLSLEAPKVPNGWLLDPNPARMLLEVSSGKGSICSFALRKLQPAVMVLLGCASASEWVQDEVAEAAAIPKPLMGPIRPFPHLFPSPPYLFHCLKRLTIGQRCWSSGQLPAQGWDRALIHTSPALAVSWMCFTARSWHFEPVVYMYCQR